jgi:tetratricopeptide (TPR) repeat protein
MSSRAAFVLSSVALVAASVAVALTVLTGAGTPPPVVPASHPAAGDVDVAACMVRIEALERRVAALTATSGGAERTVATESTAEPAAQAVEARLAKVEAAVAAIGSELAGLGPMPDTVAGIAKALTDKNLFGSDVSPQNQQRRRELWTRFLELAPRDPQAPAILQQLCNDLVAVRPRESLAALDRYEHLVDLPPLQADQLRGNALLQAGDADGARAIYARIAADHSLTEEERVGAAFLHAHAWKRQGRYDEARGEFEALIARYGTATDPALAAHARGARGQLDEMERWQGQRQR